MLIVTNGDCAADAMRAAKLDADILPWQDVLHDGPVPAGLSLAELSRVRADFLAEFDDGSTRSESPGTPSRDAESRAHARRDFEERDKVLVEAAHAEVVLWFEHDLYDQLQLLQVIDALAALEAGSNRTTIVPADDYLTHRSSSALHDDLAQRQPLSEAQVRVAQRAWAAFRADSPSDLRLLLDVEECDVLPHLRQALFRLLQEYPALTTGLSRTEASILKRLDEGGCGGFELFQAVQEQEEAMFLGDLCFFSRVRALRDSRRPPIAAVGEAPTNRSRGMSDEAEGQLFELTDVGRQLRTARADHVALNGIDKWIGGVHLSPGNVWRWDSQSRGLSLDCS